MSVSSGPLETRFPAGLAGNAARWLRANAGLLLVLVFAVCFLSTTFRAGYNSDDIVNSCSAGHIKLNDSNLLKFLEQHNRHWMKGGRFFPLCLSVTYCVHTVFANHEIPYRGFVLGLVIVDLLLFYRLLRGWRVSPAFAQLAVLSAVLLLQMRLFCDPILAFAGLLPALGAIWLATMICFQRYLESARRGWLIASVAALSAAIMTYEIGYALLPLLFAMALFQKGGWRAAGRTIGPHAIAVALLVVFTLGLRFHVPRDAEVPYRPNLQPRVVARTAFNQAASALPLCYPLSKSAKQVVDRKRWLTRWDNWAMFLAAGGLSVALLRRCRAEGVGVRVPAGALAVCGAGMWILPGLPIAVSPKYQEWVVFGRAYLPIYIQGFGVALLFAGILHWLPRTFPRWAPAAAGLLVALNACVAMIAFDTNREVARRFAETDQIWARHCLEAALRTGLGDAIPEGATVWHTKFYHWMHGGPEMAGGHLTQCLNRRIHVVVGPATPGWLADPLRVGGMPAPTFALNETCSDAKNGYVALYAIDPSAAATGGDQLNTRHVRVFVRGKYRKLAEKGDRLTFVTHSDAAGGNIRRLLDFSRMTLVERGAEGAIYEGQFDRSVDVVSVQITESASLAALPRAAASSPH